MGVKLYRNVLNKFMETFHKNFGAHTSSKKPYPHIALYGDPVLHKKCQVISQDQIKNTEVQNLIKQMVSIMRQAGKVGLAAPQIGVPLQIIVLESTDRHILCHNPEERRVKEMKTFPLKIFINPRLTMTDSQIVTFEESCASVNIGVWIPRAYGVKVTGLNENGDSVCWSVTGWPARILQHEVDHLHGKLNIDINEDKTLLDTLKIWVKWVKYLRPVR